MRLISPFVGVASTNSKLSIAAEILSSVVACCNKASVLTSAFWGHGPFASARHFNSDTFSSNPTVRKNNILYTGCCANKIKWKKTTIIATRSCWVNSCWGGTRTFFTSASVAVSGGRKISIIDEQRKAESSLRAFMAHHGGKPDKYVDFLLGMTPSEKDPNVFRGNPLYIQPDSKTAFGGSLLGQALSAAVRSVPQGFIVHSLHNYFLNAGREGSVDYHVENVRDGKTYCNRFVKAMQNGRNIINMQVSFKKDEVDPYQFQSTMPNCKRPEELPTSSELIEAKLNEDIDEDLKERIRRSFAINPVLEFRPVDPDTMFRIKPLPAKRLTWVKISEKLDEDENLHRCATAFLSDYLIITTALLPNKNNRQKFFLTSLDHSIWFHNKFSVDEWLLYETESCHAGEGVGYSTGRLWTQDGILAASVAQQGVVRSLL